MRSLGSDWTAQQPSGNPPLNRQTAHCQQCRTASVVKFATSRLRPAMGIGRYEARGVVVRRVSSRRKAQAALAAVVRHSADERASRILRGAGLQSRRPRTRILSKAGRSRSTDVETVGRGRNPWRSSSELKADASCSPFVGCASERGQRERCRSSWSCGSQGDAAADARGAARVS